MAKKGKPILVAIGASTMGEVDTVMQMVMEVTDIPLCIDTADPEALEAALSIYEGKALVNSVNGEERALKAVLPLVAEHGAAVLHRGGAVAQHPVHRKPHYNILHH